MLRELVVTSSLTGAVAVGCRGGYGLCVKYGAHIPQRSLATSRGETRVFSNLNTLAGFLKRMGITSFEVDTSGYEPVRIRPPRPDRATALRRTRTKPKQSMLELPQGIQ